MEWILAIILLLRLLKLISHLYLDPNMFKVGCLLTAVATVTGGRAQRIGEAEIMVPVF